MCVLGGGRGGGGARDSATEWVDKESVRESVCTSVGLEEESGMCSNKAKGNPK
jgi:hypothetical protein